MYTTRTSCRACGGDLLEVLDLGTQRLTAWTGSPREAGVSAPLTLMRCCVEECSLVQLRDSVEPDLMWKDASYGYRSGMNATMRRALADVTAGIASKIKLNPGDVVVDIGANDGTLLRTYPAALHRIGFEPIAKFGEESEQGGNYIISDYFDARLYPSFEAAKAVSAVAMFYDLEYPNRFLTDVRDILADDGIFVIQLSYLPLMLLQRDFLNICHEHLEYYSIRSLENLLEINGLRAFDAEINNINGGSIRVYVDKGLRSESFMLYAIREWEKALRLGTDAPYQKFAAEVEGIRSDLREAVSSGGRVYGYAASTKGNVLLQYCGFGPHDIVAVAEKNADKWGKFCAGSDIPVVSEDEMRAANPDRLLVLAWAFMDEFRQREQAWHDAGGRWIIPLPEVRVE